jgi:hypothetical protein
MMAHIPFDLRSDADILKTFGMSAGEAGRGFDTATSTPTASCALAGDSPSIARCTPPLSREGVSS